MISWRQSGLFVSAHVLEFALERAATASFIA
jgi:hypothetical protein